MQRRQGIAVQIPPSLSLRQTLNFDLQFGRRFKPVQYIRTSNLSSYLWTFKGAQESILSLAESIPRNRSWAPWAFTNTGSGPNLEHPYHIVESSNILGFSASRVAKSTPDVTAPCCPWRHQTFSPWRFNKKTKCWFTLIYHLLSPFCHKKLNMIKQNDRCHQQWKKIWCVFPKNSPQNWKLTSLSVRAIFEKKKKS